MSAAPGFDSRSTNVVVDGRPHPNPRKAAEGYRLRVLVIERSRVDSTEMVCLVRRRGGRTRTGTGLADGWQGSAVRAVLEKPCYTGYAIFGRWTKQETLFDPDDVSTGHVVRIRRTAPDRVVRSRRAAHPAIGSVERIAHYSTDSSEVIVAKGRATAARAFRHARRESGLVNFYAVAC